MKSDCTHRLNKGEATKGDIALSLSKVMADKVSEFLTKAQGPERRAWCSSAASPRTGISSGSCAEAWPQIEFVVPERGAVLRGLRRGAPRRASSGAPLPPRDELRPRGPAGRPARLRAARRPPSRSVTYVPSRRGALRPGRRVHAGRRRRLDHHQGGAGRRRDPGDRGRALRPHPRRPGRGAQALPARRCRRSSAARRPRITPGRHHRLVARAARRLPARPPASTTRSSPTPWARPTSSPTSTPSSRSAARTPSTSSSTTACPIDYAMNEACSAGTGSFLEESAARRPQHRARRGDRPDRARGRRAAEVRRALLGLHQLRHPQGHPAGRRPRADIVAGPRLLHRRQLPEPRRRQPPHRRRTSCCRAAWPRTRPCRWPSRSCSGKPVVRAARPGADGLLRRGAPRAAEARARGCSRKGALRPRRRSPPRRSSCQGEFTCQACDNCCAIRNLEVDGQRYPFGGRCSKYTNAREEARADEERVGRSRGLAHASMLFARVRARRRRTSQPRTDTVVGVPRAFSVHSLWPFYSWFFHELGVRAVLSERIAARGHRAPGEQLLLPGRDRPRRHPGPARTQASTTSSCRTSATCRRWRRQGARLRLPADPGPAVLRAPGVRPRRRTSCGPSSSFKHGWQACRPAFARVAERLGLHARRGRPRLRPGRRRVPALPRRATGSAGARSWRRSRPTRPALRRRCSAGRTTPSRATPTWASRASSPRAA